MFETFIDVCFGLCLNKAPFQRFPQADRNLTLLGSANVAGDFFLTLFTLQEERQLLAIRSIL